MFRFRVLGFDVDVQQGFLIIAGIWLLFGLQRQQPLWSITIAVLVLFVSITIHELGHALTCRRLGVPVYEVALHGLGGHVRHAPTKPRNQLLVSLAGPGIELLVGLPVLALWWFGDFEHPAIRVLLFYWSYLNVFWALVNLIPMFPLDGGNALTAYLSWRHMGPTRARTIVSQIGIASALALAGFGYLVLKDMFLLLFGAYFAYLNYQTYQRLST